ncbi:uncharacterized protein LOC143275349 [Babylonia areolata]|uniref:uncharacterized protein LOC143275349 n=1 Tax=Babylonia areolata TaxID=304850 RepID=UPI003FD4837E
MTDSRIPKMLLYGQLKEGHRELGRPCKRFKDTLKTNLKACDIDIASWETDALDRCRWRMLCSSGIKTFENKRTLAIKEKRERRKHGSTSGDVFPCNTCEKCCASRIGLLLLYEDTPPDRPACLLIRRTDGRLHQTAEAPILNRKPTIRKSG